GDVGTRRGRDAGVVDRGRSGRPLRAGCTRRTLRAGRTGGTLVTLRPLRPDLALGSLRAGVAFRPLRADRADLAVAEADDAGGRGHIDAAGAVVASHVLDRRDARGTVSTVRARIALVALRPLSALVSLRTLRAGGPSLAVGAGCAVADLVQVALPVLDQPAA